MEELGTSLTIDEAFVRAIKLAKYGIGSTSPNPPVGCVILNKNNKLIGSGYHQKYGGPHAEINALNSVRDDSELRGSTVIVTLEPCGHQGKTPPCSQALIEAGVNKLIYGVSDPNPLFNHQGIHDVQVAGIKVEKYDENSKVIEQLNDLVEFFLFSQKNSKAFISLKFASSLDGQIALNNFDSKWITNAKSRAYSHYLRLKHDSVLVGVNTIIQDNPQLNIRIENISPVTNKVIILDPNYRSKELLKKSNLLNCRSEKDVYVVCKENCKDAKEPYNFIDIKINDEKYFCLDSLSKKIKDFGLNSTLVEGGAGTISSFLKQRQFNRIYNFIAPSIIGAGGGLSWSKGLNLKSLENKIKLSMTQTKCFGDDILLEYKY